MSDTREPADDRSLGPDGLEVERLREVRDVGERALRPKRILGQIRDQLRLYEGDRAIVVPFAATSDEEVVVQIEQGRPVRAVGRRCPHRGELLDEHGRVEDGRITCKHHGYAWDCETGAVLESRTSVDPMRVGTVVLEGQELVADIEVVDTHREGHAQ